MNPLDLLSPSEISLLLHQDPFWRLPRGPGAWERMKEGLDQMSRNKIAEDRLAKWLDNLAACRESFRGAKPAKPGSPRNSQRIRPWYLVKRYRKVA